MLKPIFNAVAVNGKAVLFAAGIAAIAVSSAFLCGGCSNLGDALTSLIPDPCTANPTPDCPNYCLVYPEAVQCQNDPCAVNPAPACPNYCEVYTTAPGCPGYVDPCDANPTPNCPNYCLAYPDAEQCNDPCAVNPAPTCPNYCEVYTTAPGCPGYVDPCIANPTPNCPNYCQAYPYAEQCNDPCAVEPTPDCPNYCLAYPDAEQCQNDLCAIEPTPNCPNYCEVYTTAPGCPGYVDPCIANPTPNCPNYCQAYPDAEQCQNDLCAVNPAPTCPNYCEVYATAPGCPGYCPSTQAGCPGYVDPCVANPNAPGCQPKPITYTLTISAASGGTVSPAAGTHSYASGTSVTVTATADSGYTFKNWSGASTSASATATITMNGNKTLTANFQIKDVTQPEVPATLIWDLETGFYEPNVWFAYNDGYSYTDPPEDYYGFDSSFVNAGGTVRFYGVAGHKDGVWVGVGLTFGNGERVDISNRSGVWVTYSLSGNPVAMKFNPTPEGAESITGGNDHKMQMPSGTNRREFFRFSDFKQDIGWGTTIPVQTMLQNWVSMNFQMDRAGTATLTIKKIEWDAGDVR